MHRESVFQPDSTELRYLLLGIIISNRFLINWISSKLIVKHHDRQRSHTFLNNYILNC